MVKLWLQLKTLPAQPKTFYTQLTFYQRFMLAGFVILLLGMFGIGIWVQQQVIMGVVHNTGVTTALYVDSFITPHLQSLGETQGLNPDQTAELDKLVQDNPIGRQIVALKIWDTRGKLLYTTDRTSIVGRTYPMSEGLLRARLGDVSSEISNLDEEENQSLGVVYNQLLETYAPIWLSESNEIIAVAEFYQSTEELNREIDILVRQSWLVVGAVILVIYLLLAGFVRRASDTIQHQQSELALKVNQLTELLAQNRKLHGRVRRASASVVLLNEGYLRRIGSELHDGPAQDLGLSSLKLDAFIGQLEDSPGKMVDAHGIEQLESIQVNLQNALKEMRGIAAGLSLPELIELDLAETVARVVLTHERRTATHVDLELTDVPPDVPHAVKITLYRLVQEALNNAYHHAGGVGQRVTLSYTKDQLCVEISDQGPGISLEKIRGTDGRLGLGGMRERVESLGGSFAIDSAPDQGTKITACLPYQVEEGNAP